MSIHRLLVALLPAAAFAVPHAADAAESYGNCDHFIDALPAPVSTGGTWCLRKDLSTSIASGSAIDIQADSVVIDCNDFKIGGLAAGDGSKAIGIAALAPPFVVHRNVTIRHCNIRGFYTGIQLTGSGHLVEDNRLDNNLFTGINVGRASNFEESRHNRVRRNAIYDTGGATYGTDAYGMYGIADFTDNTIDGIFTAGSTNRLAGIMSLGAGTRVSGNRIGGLAPNGGGAAFGLLTSDYSAQSAGSNQAIANNRISATASATGTTGAGISGTGTAFCSGNTIAGFTTKQLGCTDDGGNATL